MDAKAPVTPAVRLLREKKVEYTERLYLPAAGIEGPAPGARAASATPVLGGTGG